jgi:hypothetical protein
MDIGVCLLFIPATHFSQSRRNLAGTSNGRVTSRTQLVITKVISKHSHSLAVNAVFELQVLTASWRQTSLLVLGCNWACFCLHASCCILVCSNGKIRNYGLNVPQIETRNFADLFIIILFYLYYYLYICIIYYLFILLFYNVYYGTGKFITVTSKARNGHMYWTIFIKLITGVNIPAP